MLLVEHDMHLVMDLADRVLALEFGTPIALGAPEEIQQDPRVIASRSQTCR
jgi:branched-chain amino acid transport system ATP-binding protein